MHPLIPNIISYSNNFILGDGDDEKADKDNAMVAPGGESSTNLITSISLTWMIGTRVIEKVKEDIYLCGAKIIFNSRKSFEWFLCCFHVFVNQSSLESRANKNIRNRGIERRDQCQCYLFMSA